MLLFAERRRTWRRFLRPSSTAVTQSAQSANSTDTELSTLDTHELWLTEAKWVSVWARTSHGTNCVYLHTIWLKFSQFSFHYWIFFFTVCPLFLFYFSFLSPFVLISALYSTKEPTATTMTALQQFGAEMLKLSRGLESVASSSTTCSPTKSEFSSANHFTSCSPQHYSTNKQSNQQQHVSGEHLQIPTAALAAATADSTLLLRGTSLRRSARRGRKR